MSAKQIIENETDDYVPTGSHILRRTPPGILRQFKKEFVQGSKWIRVNHNFAQKHTPIGPGQPVAVTVYAVKSDGLVFTLDGYPEHWSHLDWPSQIVDLKKVSDRKGRPMLTYTKKQVSPV